MPQAGARNRIQTNMEDSSEAGGQWRDSDITDLFSKAFREKYRVHRRTWLKSLKAKFKEAKDSNQRSGRGRLLRVTSHILIPPLLAPNAASKYFSADFAVIAPHRAIINI